MRSYGSGYSPIQVPNKYRDNDSPISRLNNLNQMKNQQSLLKDKTLTDRSNQIFLPKNASKYIKQSYQHQKNTKKDYQIQSIKKRYNQPQNDQKINISTKYDKYDIYELKNKNHSNQQNIKKQDMLLKERLLAYQKQKNISPHQKTINNIYEYSQHNSNTKRERQRQRQRPYSQINAQKSYSNNTKKQHQKFINQRYQNRQKQIDISQFSAIDRNKNKSTYSPDQNIKNRNIYEDNKQSMRLIQRQRQRYSNLGKVQTRAQTKGQVTQSYNQYNNLRSSQSPALLNTTSNNYPSSLIKKSSAYQNSYKPSTSYSNNKNYQQKSTKTKQQQSKVKQYQNRMKQKQQQFLRKQQELRKKYQKVHDKSNRSHHVNQTEEYKYNKNMLSSKNQNIKTQDYSIKQKYNRFEQNSARKTANYPVQTSKNRSIQPSLNNIQRERSVTNNNNSNVNSEIQKLESKIKQFQNRKKQMNINYTPFSKSIQKQTKQQNEKYSKQSYQKMYAIQKQLNEKLKKQLNDRNRSSLNNQQEQDFRKNKINKQPVYKHQRRLTQIQYDKQRRNYENVNNQQRKRCSFIENTKPMYSQKTLPQSKYKQYNNQTKNPNGFAFQLFRIQSEPQQSSSKISKISNLSDQFMTKISNCSTQKVSKKSNNSSKSQKNLLQCKNQIQIQKRADQGRQQRKKKLQQKITPQNANMLKRVVSLLSQQCVLDQQFRNNKIWFNSLQSDKKWRQIKKYIKQNPQIKHDLKQDSNGKLQEFLVSQDQNNPFFSVNHQSKFSNDSLIRSYINSFNHWKQKIQGKFDKLQLMGQSFNHNKFDLQKKGHINIQDLVRFLNIQSGNFYRNRDLILIYKRFLSQRIHNTNSLSNNNSNNNRLTFQVILNSLTY